MVRITEESRNLHIVSIGDPSGPLYELGFSYNTLVYFGSSDPWIKRTCINEWGPTTGKHLNFFDDGAKYDRIPQEELQALTYATLTGIGKALLTDLNTAADSAAEALADL